MVSAETLDALSRYDWPGNVRELENVVERSMILSTGPELVVPQGAIARVRSDRAPTSSQRRASPAHATIPPPTLADVERAFILKALEQTNWGCRGGRGAAARNRIEPNDVAGAHAQARTFPADIARASVIPSMFPARAR